ncbi:condensation domain-containing protein [Streptomyces sp. NPDC101181]|uniref:condensation domain-containing protein n=1 Tax=Streptomyces sp. NPDC101181 TaxID=3366125 RepID=UPI003803C114
MYWYQYHLPLPVVDSARIPLIIRMPDPGVPEDLVVSAVRNVMHRYEALRTIYPTDEHGRPFQLVLDEFQSPVPFRRDGNATEDIDAVFHALFAPPMDQATELPLRLGLNFTNRRVATLVLVINHIAVDGASRTLIKDDITQYLSASHEVSCSSADGQGIPVQPLVVARRQSNAEPSAHDRSMRYYETILKSSPAAEFPRFRPAALLESRRGGDSYYNRVVLQSSALFAALRKLHKTYGSSAANCVSVAFAVAVLALSGNSATTLRMNFSNRFAEVRQSVGCFFQEALVPIRLPLRATMSEVMAEVKKRILIANRYAQYSYLDFRDLKAKIETERGLPIRLGTVLNCSDKLERHLREPVSQDRTSAERPTTMKRFECLWRDEYTDLCLRSTARGGEVYLDLIAHRSVLEEDQIEKTLSAMEHLLIAWANELDMATATVAEVIERFGLPVSAYGEEWVHVDHSWVDTAKLARFLSSVEGVEAARAKVVERPSGDQALVAQLVGEPSRQDQVRAHVLASMRENVDLMCPSEFVWYDELPGPGSSSAAGTTMSGASEGTACFPAGPESRAASAGYEALATAVELALGGIRVDMDRSYIQQGGSAVLTPAVTKHLNRLGFEGLSPDDLMGPWPLWAAVDLCTKRVRKA